jgi:hypothetical protein
MRREDLMKSDLLSEILLLGSGAVIVAALVITIVMTIMQTGAMQ